MGYLKMKTLLERTSTRFRLVIMVAQRARQLTSSSNPMGSKMENDKAIDQALHEIEDGKIEYKELKKIK
ncbi:DNA-directed RNA polymerase subunit omega [Candidatus Desantisbacteria bacterium]|nr:DNA-directed RNA polymerase subunit omega [Candidatus Desantisbacteria bacterium]